MNFNFGLFAGFMKVSLFACTAFLLMTLAHAKEAQLQIGLFHNGVKIANKQDLPKQAKTSDPQSDNENKSEATPSNGAKNTMNKAQDEIEEKSSDTIQKAKGEGSATDKHKQASTPKQKGFKATPFFFVQAGLGGGAEDKNLSPLLALSIGYNQQFSFYGLPFGFKLSLDYELWMRAIREGTIVRSLAGAHFSAYLGADRYLAYGGVGYSFLFGTGVTAASGALPGNVSYVAGFVVVIDRYSSIDISFRYFKDDLRFCRGVASYEFRF